ncbi:DUF2922 domain-containing protein [Tumebacillus permanentifrigoris]|uniref:DUF2922 family protein n=1 Tax=Tumebacillus permanentifrigoris TaxID=378543 RepID=A0A316D631_9BACL|nr:DUF2922 domain-containing protein [Tumebacillus permanentifrigoris]PWK07876.1 hypothetical protein C7459_11635 [Tumebacillus permanentifrigoris]PWK07884.1 hypothetical protein C7459_11643 [Tumebacillus permanentifrigoris]
MQKRDLELYFSTNLNKKVKLVIPEPRHDLTTAEIQDVMDLVIQKGIFGFPQGLAVEKLSARIVESSVEKIEI